MADLKSLTASHEFQDPKLGYYSEKFDTHPLNFINIYRRNREHIKSNL